MPISANDNEPEEARFVETKNRDQQARSTATSLDSIRGSGIRPDASPAALAAPCTFRGRSDVCSNLWRTSDFPATCLARGGHSEVDARDYRFRLTPTGRRVVTDLAVPRAPDFVDAVADKLSATQRRQMVALLRKLFGLNKPASGD